MAAILVILMTCLAMATSDKRFCKQTENMNGDCEEQTLFNFFCDQMIAAVCDKSCGVCNKPQRKFSVCKETSNFHESYLCKNAYRPNQENSNLKNCDITYGTCDPDKKFCNQPEDMNKDCERMKNSCEKNWKLAAVCDKTCGVCKGPQRKFSVCKETKTVVQSIKCMFTYRSDPEKYKKWKNCDISDGSCDPDCEDTPGYTSQHGRTCEEYFNDKCENGSPTTKAEEEMARYLSRSGKGNRIRKAPQSNCCRCGKAKLNKQKRDPIEQALDFYRRQKFDDYQRRQAYFQMLRRDGARRRYADLRRDMW